MNYDIQILEVVLLSLFVSITSTFIASIIGMAVAIPIALSKFKYKVYFIRLTQTLMSIPPVLMGLVIYLVLSRKGPLGEFQLLFTPAAMIMAQTLLIIPIIIGLTVPVIEAKGSEIRKNITALGGERGFIIYQIILECRTQLLSIVAAGFGRGISEVGAIMMVGGNIKGETRVMTTYIALETSQGNFDNAITIGVILLFVSLIVNFFLHKVNRD